MRLSVSNLAWPQDEAAAAAELLRTHGVDAVDLTPGACVPNPGAPSREAADQTRRWWNDRGLEIVGMQALLFGTTGLNMLGGATVQDAMLIRLASVAELAAILGATRLTFGSLRNRNRGTLADSDALEVAVPFFRRLGDICQHHGVLICLEPISTTYACDFMTTTDETVDVVAQVDHPNALGCSLIQEPS